MIMIADYRYDEGLRIRANDLCPALPEHMGSAGGLSSMIMVIEGEEMETSKNGVQFDLRTEYKKLKETIQKNSFGEETLNLDLFNKSVNADLSQTLLDPCHNQQALYDGLKIRRLTPKEAWRLMGFDDSDYEQAAKFNSKSALYRQAGNSIVVQCLEAILGNLLNETTEDYQTTIFDYL